MSRGRKSSNPVATAQPASSHVFDQTMLAVLLTLIPLRAFVSETVIFEVARMFRHIPSVGTASPGTTMLFAMVIIGAAVATWVRRLAAGGPRYRWTGAEPGLILLIVSGVIAYSVAGQKHLALIGAVNLITLILYGLTLRQYLTSPWRMRLALVVIVGTACVVVAKCAVQYTIEHEQTIRYWEENKGELLGEEANVTSGKAAGMRHDYEKRMLSRLVTGYYPHANVLGSHLILFIMAAAAIIGDRLRRRSQIRGATLTIAGPAVLIIACLLAMMGTGSKGALACAMLALGLWILGGVLRSQIAKHRGKTAVVVWIGAVVGVATLIVLLNKNEAVLGKSIQYRSMYWRGAAAMIADGHALGVGPLNFGRHFLQYKPVECPEEVESPHSWPVQLASEWGILGLVGFVLILVGISWRMARRTSIPDPPESGIRQSIAWWPLVLMATVFSFWLLQVASAGAYLVAFTLMIGGAPWLLGCLLLSVESRDDARFPNEPLVGAMPALVGGLLGFLLHTGIDLALFEGGPATTFFAMVAIALALADSKSSTEDESDTPVATPAAPRRGLAVAVSIGALVLAFVWYHHHIAAPFQYHRSLTAGRVQTDRNGWHEYFSRGGGVDFVDAIRSYSLDATACYELAEQVIPRVQSLANVDEALGIVDELERRDPHNGLHHSLRAPLATQRFHLTGDVQFLRQAATSLNQYVEHYPTSPLRRIHLASTLTQLALQHDDAEARAEAIRQMEKALELDEQRIHVSKPNRLPAEHIEQIRELIKKLRRGE